MKPVLFSVMAAAGFWACSHAKSTDDAPQAAKKGEQPQAQSEERSPKPVATHATSTTTRQMFKPDGLRKLQEALAEKGSKRVRVTGVLDEQTQQALRAYQKMEGIAETGMPDYESVRRLGLDPDQVFHHAPPAKRIGVK